MNAHFVAEGADYECFRYLLLLRGAVCDICSLGLIHTAKQFLEK